MKELFAYNWLVRDEWFAWCAKLPDEELLQKRVGGAGSILYTLFHVADVEYSWLRGVQGKPDVQLSYEEHQSLGQIKALSDEWREELREFLDSWTQASETEPVRVEWSAEEYVKGEILRHVIAHEIHHMGQLSVWARELGRPPVSANFIGRGLMRSNG
ncbi:DinB family protein [Brevibacillus parabrevis]|uniref:DNA damage-inducible protein DinB n=1 Tax=Brevibacillus parabrevis TaxID=54914 RepID=A0A4Y3PDI2_BREPA|nr:DinB family protein [Brevibacillus parabrevis]RNB94778.1 DUF664 domain-containing protein [Brevibacillus parabrevis]GEB32482.1 DNA damage-inducible protein DinB [Brevibacillus parabrevis]